ncbi:MAG TPA: AtpZ/AtpI family protein [Paracoccaceae bacterium]|nr:AtpZ/AtpI family protein [Paracoccaceae bacterium]
MEEDGARRLRELEARIEAARKASEPARRGEGGKFSGVELGWRMMIDLVVGVLIGCGIGYGLDALFGTVPAFLILFSLLGFAAGVRVMMRTAREYQKRLEDAAAAGEDGDRKGP